MRLTVEPGTGMLPWAGRGSEIGRHVREQSERCLRSYRENPLLITEHANIERATAQGGYGRRQIYELVQNGADALIGTENGAIEVVLTDTALYCANQGIPIDLDGVDALLSSHISMKRGTEIGRFGLGFKSVLGVTDRPEFFSRSGSFAFDARDAEYRIRAVVPEATRMPALRIAKELDPTEAGRDPILRRLMEWATTIVRLPRQAESSPWLSEDLQNFPPEFLLFSPHVAHLVLDDQTSGSHREIQVQRAGSAYKLVEGDTVSSWKVFATQHKPSAEARKDAGELAERESLPLIWAVPLEGRTSRGRFWAFFPTEYVTTLKGIVNAPWKTNEDRQNLLTGKFNSELIDVTANLVVDNLPNLVDPSEPGRFLDLLPARGEEAPQWADRELSERVYQVARERPSLPNQLGELRRPNTLNLHPRGVNAEALEEWAKASSRPIDWCHPSVETRERRPRVERLIQSLTRSFATYDTWLEALVRAPTAGSSAAALRVAGKLLTADNPPTEEIKRARIVLTSDGALVAPVPGALFLESRYRSATRVDTVNAEVLQESDARATLTKLGITPVDASGELEAVTMRGFAAFDDADWTQFWDLVRAVDSARALEILKTHVSMAKVRVRTVSGEFLPLTSTLLPGAVVPEDGSRDAAVATDLTFHRADIELLSDLGAVASPTLGKGSPEELWSGRYRGMALGVYQLALEGHSKHPDPTFLEFRRAALAGPLDPLPLLSDEGKARFTEALLQADPEPTPWVLRHRTMDHYPAIEIESPALWMIRAYGRLETSQGYRKIDDCVGPALAQWKLMFAVATSARASQVLGVPDALEGLPDRLWGEAFNAVDRLDDDATIGSFYSMAAGYREMPERLRCRFGDAYALVPPAEVAAVSNRRELQALVAERIPVILVPTEADRLALTERWGLRPADRLVRTELLAVPSSTEVPLIDAYSALRWRLDDDQKRTLLVRCSVLRLETLTERGKYSEEKSFHAEEGRIYCLDSIRPRELLARVSTVFGLNLGQQDFDQILELQVDEQRRQRLVIIRRLKTLAEKVALAVGPENLRQRLPKALLDMAEADGSFERGEAVLGQLALAVYGVDVLHECREELEHNGFAPPAQWAGSHGARAFVTELGFPQEYAGFEHARRDPLVEVDGPPLLPAMHEYQRLMADGVRQLLRGEGGMRALLALPTGAGKTRVAVEALIEAIRDQNYPTPILWIAQSDELCEQAVQTWTYIWRALGPRQPLSISRLWAGNEASALEGSSHVVVATIDKLQGCLAKPEYGWLSDARAVVVDEAHGAIAPSYTRVLDWLGLGRVRGNDRCPLLGLTATPYRGVSEEETLRLIQRFDNNRIDRKALGDDPYRELQRMRVLSSVSHRLLEGSDIQLTPKELDQLKRTRLMPSSAEDRLGGDASRNRALMESIITDPEKWSILVFATSVEHAQTMAALLSLRGISAAAVSAATEPGARRHYINEFREGRIRVLTNYAVLTQGFDAPAVRAIYVARPTYSPNLYQQMIGRGLRGPLNGGTEDCLIVNVKDNVLQYGEELAFREFEHLWVPETSQGENLARS